MLNFNYCNPTRIIFGRDEHRRIGSQLKAAGFERALIVYGGGSALKNGTIAAVQASLEENAIEYFTIGGVRSNVKKSSGLTTDINGRIFSLAVPNFRPA